ncbi:IclR family transcriptional regulator [Nitriliruptoraceae bacterium ZYF776]|nr:IclR family transcriptional regulator [Profundirhabdus halotolerans]
MPGTKGADPQAETSPAIQTVQRAAMILSAFTVEKPTLSLNEITRLLGTSKATAHRYTKALRDANLLRFDPNENLYALGPQILALEAAARAGLPIVTAAEPHLQRLRQEVDETVVLSVWDGVAATVVRSVDNTGGVIQLSVRLGSRLDPVTSAQGRVFTAFQPEPARRRRDPELTRELEEIRRTGLSVNTPAVNGVRTIATPVFEHGEVVAVIAVVATQVSLSEDQDTPIAEALRRAAVALSVELGSDAADFPGAPTTS